MIVLLGAELVELSTQLDVEVEEGATQVEVGVVEVEVSAGGEYHWLVEEGVGEVEGATHSEVDDDEGGTQT